MAARAGLRACAAPPAIPTEPTAPRAEADALEANLKYFDRMLCGTFEAVRNIGPGDSSGVVSRLLGVDAICRTLKLPLEPNMEYIAKQRQRIQAGDLDGYAMISLHFIDGLRSTTNDWSDRANAGCPYAFRGAQLDNPASMGVYLRSCMQPQRSTEEERKQAMDMLRGCVAREVPGCITILGHMYSLNNPLDYAKAMVPRDDNEGLRLLDKAASMGDAQAADSAARLRRRMAGIKEPPPGSTPSAPPTDVALRTGTYRISDNNNGVGGVCIVTALGNGRYAFDWRYEARARTRSLPENRKLEAEVEGQAITFKVDDEVRTYKVTINTPTMFVLVQNGGPVTERLSWESSAVSVPVVATAGTELPSRSPNDRPALGPRCVRLQDVLASLRVRAQNDPRYSARLERSDQQYQKECGSR